MTMIRGDGEEREVSLMMQKMKSRGLRREKMAVGKDATK